MTSDEAKAILTSEFKGNSWTVIDGPAFPIFGTKMSDGVMLYDRVDDNLRVRAEAMVRTVQRMTFL